MIFSVVQIVETWFCWYCLGAAFNPFTAPASKISMLKNTYMPPDSIPEGPVTNLFSILCILVEILPHAHVKGAEKP